MLSRRFTCLKVVIPLEGSAVLVAKLALHLPAARAEGNEATAGKGVARPDSEAFPVFIARWTRRREIVRTEEARRETTPPSPDSQE